MISKKADNEPLRRSGAKVDDSICVTGSLGGSGYGKHLTFEPRVKDAIKIAQMVKVHSMIDISDGLSSDLNRICRQSSVGALINAEQIPVSPQARKNKEPLNSALNDGEDFELLFTLSQEECRRLLEQWDEPTAITQIGSITDTKKMQIKMTDGRIIDLLSKGYDHLKN
jgi:thiamine-monophosphate kinase